MLCSGPDTRRVPGQTPTPHRKGDRHAWTCKRRSTLDGQLDDIRDIPSSRVTVEDEDISFLDVLNCVDKRRVHANVDILTAKQRLEACGWRVVHGIVDSIWVTPDPDVDDEDREDLETLATAITKRVEIRLEHEAHYDWVAFVPQRESDAGALTRFCISASADTRPTPSGTPPRTE